LDHFACPSVANRPERTVRVAFSAAAAGGTVARLRGYQSWPWVCAVGFTGATLTGYFRMAADKHWLTDVLASAAVGTGVGMLVPWLHGGGPVAASLRLLPAPGGLAVAGEF
jgi:membrane-associated phospholipid phosphatase